MKKDPREIAREMGLEIGTKSGAYSTLNYYKADDVHKLLAKGVEVFGCPVESEKGWALGVKKDSDDTHVGLCIGLKPIDKVPVTAEDLIRELADQLSSHNPLHIKARKFLEAK